MNSTSSDELVEDKTIISQILVEMKSEFNRSEKEEITVESSETTEDLPELEDKPRIILSFKKPVEASRKKVKNTEINNSQIPEESVLKRSARRRSRDCGESVLQSAIARKEKSYNESNKPQRLTRQLKPTQKILENLELARQEKCSKRGCSDTEEDQGMQVKRKIKKKKSKNDSSKESDSDQGSELNGRENSRRSRRISNNRCKEESNTDCDDDKTEEKKTMTSRLCLCSENTQYYVEANNEDITYCGAVDNIGDKLIGCNRTVTTNEIMLLRPSSRVSYMILCESHKNRLLRHNCCPNCGVFCTQGHFYECEFKHHFHRICQMMTDDDPVTGCPHCGNSISKIYEVHITMHSDKRPIFLPTQKTVGVSARMTFPINHKETESKSLSSPLLPVGILDMQNSLQYGDNDEYEIDDLIDAVKNNSIEKVAEILGSKSVDITCQLSNCNEGTILHLAAQACQTAIVHMLLVAGALTDAFDKDQNTAVMAAILSKNNDVISYLIKTGADINLKGTDGMTALHLAAKCGNLVACEHLLKAPSHVRNYVNMQDDGGWTPLVWACEHGYDDVATFLITKGADIGLRDVEHNVALHWAAFSGSSHIAELLLNQGCDVNAVNAHGDTPLHIGARQDMYDCNMILLARGADVTILNKNRESPLHCVPPGGDSYSPIALNITLQVNINIDYNTANVILSNDISKGREANPIQCINSVDGNEPPSDFHYVIKNCVTSDDVKIERKITSLQCCQCEERCVGDNCSCGKFSVRCWYDEEGKLGSEFNYNDIPMIFECNDRCACNAITCNNRVMQRGLSQRFELFRTEDKGWGVRSLRLIPKGSFVCEYIGEIITDVEADQRDDDGFVFDLDNRIIKSSSELDTYCIDAKFYGNFSRFINHSCDPNLISVKVFVEHQDLRFPRIAFFANRDITRLEELTFDYGEKFWLAKCKSLSCLCRSVDCRYSQGAFAVC